MNLNSYEDFFKSLPIEVRKILFVPSYSSQNCLPDTIIAAMEHLDHPLKIKPSKKAHFRLRKMVTSYVFENKALYEPFINLEEEDVKGVMFPRSMKNKRLRFAMFSLLIFSIFRYILSQRIS